MFKVGDKVSFVSVSKFQKEFDNQIGMIDNIKPKDKYCNHVCFKNDKLNKEAEHLWWEDRNLKLIKMSDEDYNNLTVDISELKGYTFEENLNEGLISSDTKYGFKYIEYAKTIAKVELGISFLIAFIYLISTSETGWSGVLASIITIFAGFAGYVLLLLFASMAENLAYIRKNTEKHEK
jgi:hypothetical protein